jgi:2-C-methyl-D-erythritol 4-phosphate cytidylyltransferase
VNYGLVVAAGEGSRFGGRKQFARLRSKPIVYYSLRAFERCPIVKEIVLVTSADMICRIESWLRRWRFRKVEWVVAGGERRQDSVRQGLRALPDRGLVAIHDGARPILRPEHLILGFRQCRKARAVIYALPVSETVKETSAGQVAATIPRQNLALAQTPQFFDLALIKLAYDRAYADGRYASDDAQLVEHLGIPVSVLPGWPENIKVTFPADLRVAAQFL